MFAPMNHAHGNTQQPLCIEKDENPNTCIMYALPGVGFSHIHDPVSVMNIVDRRVGVGLIGSPYLMSVSAAPQDPEFVVKLSVVDRLYQGSLERRETRRESFFSDDENFTIQLEVPHRSMAFPTRAERTGTSAPTVSSSFMRPTNHQARLPSRNLLQRVVTDVATKKLIEEFLNSVLELANPASEMYSEVMKKYPAIGHYLYKDCRQLERHIRNGAEHSRSETASTHNSPPFASSPTNSVSSFSSWLLHNAWHWTFLVSPFVSETEDAGIQQLTKDVHDEVTCAFAGLFRGTLREM